MTKRVWLVENVDGRECLVGRMPPDTVILNVIRVPTGSLEEWPGVGLSVRNENLQFGSMFIMVFVLLMLVPLEVLFRLGHHLSGDHYVETLFGGTIVWAVLCTTAMEYLKLYFPSRHARKIKAFCEKYEIQADPTTVGRLGGSSGLKCVLLEEGEGL